MKKLLLPLGLATTLVLAVVGMAIADAHGGDAVFGCCCPYSAWLGSCPQTVGAFTDSWDDACMIFDEDGELVTFCQDDPDGVYPYRGMTLEEIAVAVGPNFGLEFETVGAMMDFFCGYDWDRWLATDE